MPYRNKLKFTFEGVKSAAKNIERLRDFEARVSSAKLPPGKNQTIADRSAAATRQFEESLDDDLNTAEALAAIFEYVRAMNTALDDNQFHEENRWDAARVLEVFDTVFDVLKPTPANAAKASGPSDAEIEALIEERNQAKKSKNFKRSDEIRNLLLEKGILLEDTKDGVRWKRK